jgi:DNA-damage-inducible protein J
MATMTVNIRMDADLYRQFSDFADRIEVSVPALVSSFATATVRHQRLPFDLSAELFNNPVNQARVRAAINQLEQGGGAAHDLIDL